MQYLHYIKILGNIFFEVSFIKNQKTMISSLRPIEVLRCSPHARLALCT